MAGPLDYVDAYGRVVGDPRALAYGPTPAPPSYRPTDNLPAAPAYTPAPQPEDTANAFQRGLRRSTSTVMPTLRALAGSVRTAMGDQGGTEQLHRAVDEMQAAELRDPSMTFSEAAKKGELGSKLGDLAGSAVPDFAMLALPGGVGGTVARGMARQGVKAAAREIGERAAQRQLQKGALELAPEVVAKQGTEAATRAAVADATDTAAATAARRLGATKAATDASKAATAAGAFAGTAAGAYPGAVAGAAPDVFEAADSKDAAQKSLAGAVPQAALMAVVPGRALAKLGAPAAAEGTIANTIRSYIPKVAKAAAKEGGAMAALSVPQTAAALATHGWIKDNIDVLPPGALDQYLDGIVSGGIMGAAFGGGTEAVHAFPGAQIKSRLKGFLNRTGVALDRASNTAANTFDSSREVFDNAVKQGSDSVEAGVASEHFDNAVKAGQSALDSVKDALDSAPKAANDFYGKAKDLLDQLRGSVGDKDAFKAMSEKFGDALSKLEMYTGALQMHPDTRAAFKDTVGALSDPQAKEAFAGAFHSAWVDNYPGFRKDAKAATLNTQFSALQQAMKDVTTDKARNELRTHLTDLLEKHADESAVTGDEHAQSFNDHLNNLNADEEVGSHQPDELTSITDRYNKAQAQGPAAKDLVPFKLETPLQTAIAAHIDPNDPIMRQPDLVRNLAASAEKLFTGGETHRDLANIDALKAHVGEDTIHHWMKFGKDWAERNHLEEQVRTTDLPAVHADMSTPELRDRVVAADVGTDEHSSAQSALRERLMKQGALFTQNMNKPESRAAYHRFMAERDPTKNASTVEIEPKVINERGDTRRQFLQLDSLVSAKLAEQPGIGAKAALHEALGDLAIAGVKVDPKTITMGHVWTAKDKTSSLSLNANEAAFLRKGVHDAITREQAAKLRDIQARSQGAAAAEHRTPREKEIGDAMTRDENARARERGLAGETRGEEFANEHRYSGEASATGERELHQQGARQPPPPSKGSGIADVHLGKAPYAKEIAQLRKDRAAAKTPKERRALLVEAGRNIGETELRKQRTDGRLPNDARLAAELRKLHANDDIAVKWAKDADAGKFDDTPRVDEQKADKAEMAKGEQRDAEQYTDEDVKHDNVAFERQNRDQPENPRSKAKPLDEQALAEISKKDNATQARTRNDEDIAAGFNEASKNKGPHDHAKEARMLNAVLAKMGFGAEHHITVEPLSASVRKSVGGQHEGNVIRINPNLRGKERIEVLAHELGHHIINIELGQEFEKATPELREALLKDHAEWMKQQFGDKIASDVLGSRKPYFRGQRVMNESTGQRTTDLPDEKFTYLYDKHEWLADHIARALTAGEEGQNVIGKFFSGLARQFKAAYDALFGTPEGKQYAPNATVEKWVKSLFDRTTNDVSDALGYGVSHQQALAATASAFHAFVGATDKVSGLAFRRFARFANTVLDHQQRRIFERALDRGVVERQLRSQYGNDQSMMKLLEGHRRLDALIYLAHREFMAGRLNLGPATTEPMRSMSDQLFRVMGLAGTNEFALRMMRDFQDMKAAHDAGNTYDVRAKEAADRGRPQEILNAATQIGRGVGDAVRPILWGAGDRMHLTLVPAIRRINALVRLHSSEPGKDSRHDLLNARVTQKQLFVNRATDVLKNLSRDENLAMVEALQRGQTTHANGRVQDAIGKIHELMADAAAYAKKAGIEMGKTANFWPVVLDGTQLRDRAGDFKSLLGEVLQNPAALKDAQRSLASTEGKNAQTAADILHGYALDGNANDGQHDLTAPSFSAKNRRVMGFMYKYGTPDQINRFAAFQAKDPADIIAPYIDSLVNRAEFARRFGEDGGRLEALLKQAEGQGASPKDVQLARDFVNASIGHYGANGSEILKSMIGPERSAKVTKKFAPVSDALMTYQNVRVLPLALLSSLADPLGIFVRSGGEWKGVWTGLRDGLKALKDEPHQLKELAHAVGIAEDYMNVDALRNNYSVSGGSTTLRKVNDTVFRLNGLTQWSKALRYMALSVGQGFLLRHAALANEHSARYLFELGVKAGDIHQGAQPGTIKLLSEAERASASKTALAADDRVRKALVRFVEDSILRTNASQHPIYMNDPVAKVFSQYKQFAYAFEQQIIERMSHELKYYNNYKVLAPFFAYAPITMLAEMLRGGIQYGPSGNPNRDDWGPAEYLGMGAERAGILGPKAEFGLHTLEGRHYGHMLGLPDLGPTASQFGELARTAEGRASPGHTLADAMPASPLFVHRMYGSHPNGSMEQTQSD